MAYVYKTTGVCPENVIIELDNDVIVSAKFDGGKFCPGNCKAVSKLVEGLTVSKLSDMLEGNTCGKRNTSCVDQLIKGVKEAYSNQR